MRPHALLPFLALLACSSDDAPAHPTGRDVGVRVLPAMCDRAAACQPEAFAAEWGTRDACITDLASLADPAAVDKPSPCSSSELDACVADARSVSCSAFTSDVRTSIGSAFPSTCSKC